VTLVETCTEDPQGTVGMRGQEVIISSGESTRKSYTFMNFKRVGNSSGPSGYDSESRQPMRQWGATARPLFTAAYTPRKIRLVG
jgi:hypothetical protein